MYETFAVLAGILVGLLATTLRTPRAALGSIVVLGTSSGIALTIVSGEYAESVWFFVADVAQVLLAAGIVFVLVRQRRWFMRPN